MERIINNILRAIHTELFLVKKWDFKVYQIGKRVKHRYYSDYGMINKSLKTYFKSNDNLLELYNNNFDIIKENMKKDQYKLFHKLDFKKIKHIND